MLNAFLCVNLSLFIWNILSYCLKNQQPSSPPPLFIFYRYIFVYGFVCFWFWRAIAAELTLPCLGRDLLQHTGFHVKEAYQPKISFMCRTLPQDNIDIKRLASLKRKLDLHESKMKLNHQLWYALKANLFMCSLVLQCFLTITSTRFNKLR